MIPQITSRDVGDRLTWRLIVAALEAGHRLPKAEISDQFLHRGKDTLLSRVAWVDGLGFGVKSVSVMSGNSAKNMPTVQGVMLVFEDINGAPIAVIDSDLVTKWKTAADSVLGAKLLARPDSTSLLIIGAGTVATNVIHAYRDIFPRIKDITVWNRSFERAEHLVESLAREGITVHALSDLAQAAATADIISTATMAREPVLKGEWVRPGTHVDLIGAFKSDMREADDTLLQKARLFVDSRETTVHHIGELMIPLASGAICEADVIGDLYDLVTGIPARLNRTDITVFKNGGGAHLDLMTAKAITELIG